jgi:hypothetical protein
LEGAEPALEITDERCQVYVRVWRGRKWNVGRRAHEYRYYFSVRFGIRLGRKGWWFEKRYMREGDAQQIYLLLRQAHLWVKADRESLREAEARGEVKKWVSEKAVKPVDVSLVGLTPEEVIARECEEQMLGVNLVELEDED